MAIFFVAIFLLGFVADPIINLYLDPYDTITQRHNAFDDDFFDDLGQSWTLHLFKGLASAGLLGFVKVLLVNPWQWWNLRGLGGSGRGVRGTTGRDRVESISWIVIVLGASTFLYVSGLITNHILAKLTSQAVWKVVRAFSRRVLQNAMQRVVDVEGDDQDDED